MPWSALPKNLQTPEAWKGSDNDVWYMRWEILTKGWFAFGPRATEWWGRWREIPAIIFAIGGKGPWRWEYTDGSKPEIMDCNKSPVWGGTPSDYVLSRIQYWKRWHFAIQWPFQITFHRYWSQKDVPSFTERPEKLGVTKLLYLYGPTHRDADLVYWLFSFFIGGEWK